MTVPVFKIIPTTQQYDWGKIGRTSKIAQLASSRDLGLTIDDAQPYAEVNEPKLDFVPFDYMRTVMDGDSPKVPL